MTWGVAWGVGMGRWEPAVGPLACYRTQDHYCIAHYGAGAAAEAVAWTAVDAESAIERFAAWHGLAVAYTPGARPPESDPRLLPAWARVGQPIATQEAAPGAMHLEIALGWPMRALSMRVGMGDAHEGGLVRRVNSARFWALPATIIPGGFAVNTLLAASIVLLGVEGFSFVRRRVRSARGRCAACGYDRVGLGVGEACPECGSSPAPLGRGG